MFTIYELQFMVELARIEFERARDEWRAFAGDAFVKHLLYIEYQERKQDHNDIEKRLFVRVGEEYFNNAE